MAVYALKGLDFTARSTGCGKLVLDMLCNKGTALQLAEKVIGSGRKCQGTTSVVPQLPQNQCRALAPAKVHSGNSSVEWLVFAACLAPEGWSPALRSQERAA
jgi:hypothetical protein